MSATEYPKLGVRGGRVLPNGAAPDPGPLERGVSLEAFVVYLSQWIYFWPGDRFGPQKRAIHLAIAGARKKPNCGCTRSADGHSGIECRATTSVRKMQLWRCPAS